MPSGTSLSRASATAASAAPGLCRQVTKFYQLKTHLQGVSLQLMTMKSVDAMATAVKNTTRAMVRMNQR